MSAESAESYGMGSDREFAAIIYETLRTVKYDGPGANRRFLAALQDMVNGYPKEKKILRQNGDDKFLGICGKASFADPDQMPRIRAQASGYLQQEYTMSEEWADRMGEAFTEAFARYGGKDASSLHPEKMGEAGGSDRNAAAQGGPGIPDRNTAAQGGPGIPDRNAAAQGGPGYSDASAMGEPVPAGLPSGHEGSAPPAPKKTGKRRLSGKALLIGCGILIALFAFGVSALFSGGEWSEKSAGNDVWEARSAGGISLEIPDDWKWTTDTDDYDAEFEDEETLLYGYIIRYDFDEGIDTLEDEVSDWKSTDESLTKGGGWISDEGEVEIGGETCFFYETELDENDDYWENGYILFVPTGDEEYTTVEICSDDDEAFEYYTEKITDTIEIE